MKKFLLLIRPENTVMENDTYKQAITRFGGEVITVLDTISEGLLLKKLEQIDGILLPGGNEVGKLDFYLIDYAINHQLKLLGICQGMQSMALWGSQDSLVEIGSLDHEQAEGYVHSVFLKDGFLRELLGVNKILVNSHHHHTVKNSLFFNVVGRSDDELIEAVEGSSTTFQIGVQWHPERMVENDKYSQILLKHFINS